MLESTSRACLCEFLKHFELIQVHCHSVNKLKLKRFFINMLVSVCLSFLTIHS